jgi:hypothetical protein
MPDLPNFEQLAQRLDRECSTLMHSLESDQRVDHIALRLREIWNARGVADLARVEYELSTLMGSTAADPYIRNLYRALRSLDR